ncbi:unnamed protein product [Alopecurus aequalis]
MQEIMPIGREHAAGGPQSCHREDRGWLQIRAAAENALPGWRLSFLVSLRRRLRLAVTSQCVRATAPAEQGKKPRGLKIPRFLRSRLARAPPLAAVAKPSPRTPSPGEQGQKPRGLKIIRFLRSRLARAPRASSVLPPPPPPPPRASVAQPSPRTPAIPSLLRNLAPMRAATTMALCFLAAASVAELRVMAGFMVPSTSCSSWGCFLAGFVMLPLFEWLSKISSKFLDPPLCDCDWLGLPKLSLKWPFNK